MAAPTRFPIRLGCPVGLSPIAPPPRDIYNNQPPAAWIRNHLRLEVGLLDRQGINVITDISDLASITCEIKASQTTDTLYATQTLAAGALQQALTQNNWNAGTDQHALFLFSDADTYLDLGGAAKKDFWLVISYLTTDAPAERVTVFAGAISFYQDNTPSGGAPVGGGGDSYYTEAQSDARYPLRVEANANYRFANGQLQIWDPQAFAADNTKPWRALTLLNGATAWSAPIAN